MQAAKFRAAADFIAKNARLLDRLRFAFLFEKGAPSTVVRALEPYQNADGGFGHGLEPDLRGPESEPVPVWTALGILDEVDRLKGPIVQNSIRYLRRISRSGGVPFVLPSASRSPHAPWWETGAGPVRPALNPTAGIAGLLHKHHHTDPWLTRATAWCWKEIDAMTKGSPYEIRVVLQFLDFVPDRRRAEATLERLRPLVLDPEVVTLEITTDSDAFQPLDFAPDPGLLSRTLFTQRVIDRHLDALSRAQKPDGGWDVAFPIWTPLTGFEWRSWRTIEALKILKVNGRL